MTENQQSLPTNKPSPGEQQKQERTWAMFCHLSALASLIIWVPCANILGPLIIWLLKKNESKLIEEEGKEALNFQISMTIYMLAAFLLMFIGIGFILIFPLAIVNLVLVIMAAIKTSNGEKFKYPATIRLIK